MRPLLVVDAAAALAMLLIGLHRGREPGGGVYGFTLPFILQCAGALMSAVVGVFSQRLRDLALTLSSLLLALLFVTWWYALRQWPGGDDGGGYAWMYFVGACCLVCLPVGLVIFLVGRTR